MSDDGTVHVVDLADAVSDPAERTRLIRWGASYLASNDENVQIRAASLALEFRDMIFRDNRSRGQRPSFWQCRLAALALVTACIRARAEQMGEGNATRH